MKTPQRHPCAEWEEFKNKEPLARSHKPLDAEIGEEAIFPPESMTKPKDDVCDNSLDPAASADTDEN